MEHYEIREMMLRTVDPALEIEFECSDEQAAYHTIEFDAQSDTSREVPISTIVRNKSNQPSMYSLIVVFIDKRVELTGTTDWNWVRRKELSARGHRLERIYAPGSFPIFREMPRTLHPFRFTIHQRLLAAPLKLDLGYQIRAPGCFKENYGSIDIDQSGRLAIRMPPN
jgi:hypothetical protein